MEKQFVTYEIALKLKELGFDEPCLAYFESVYDGLTQKHAGRLVLGNKPEHLQSYKQLIYIFGQNNQLAPLWQQAIDWFWDKHNILISPHMIQSKKIIWQVGYNFFNSKEEAILKALTLI